MFKNIISPVQAWLLSQARCVGCGTSLLKAKPEYFSSEEEKYSCHCGRIFILNTKSKKYRRALLNEI